jgi:Aspartyl protease
MPTILCPGCGKTHFADEAHAGRQFQCHTCGRLIAIALPLHPPPSLPPTEARRRKIRGAGLVLLVIAGAAAWGLWGVTRSGRDGAVPPSFVPDPVPLPASVDGDQVIPANGATIRFTPGKSIIADARINGATWVRLLVDTGADMTTISLKVLTAAGVPMHNAVSHPLVGATGLTQVQAVVLDSLEVQDARVRGLTVDVFQIAHLPEGIDGLLGRDFLDRFDLIIDRARSTATIRPARTLTDSSP